MIRSIFAAGSFLLLGVLSAAELDLNAARTEKSKGNWGVRPEKAFEHPGLLSGGGASARIPFRVENAGSHEFHVAFFTQKDKAGNFMVLIRNPQGEAVHCEKVDYPMHALNRSTPYKGYALAREAGRREFTFRVVLEYPGDYSVQFRSLPAKGITGGRYYIESLSCTEKETAKTASPAGLVPAPVRPLNVNLYTGMEDATKRFKTGIIQNGSIYDDPAALVNLGATHEQGVRGEEDVYLRYGLKTMGGAYGGVLNLDRDFFKAHPAPEGRFVNAEGKVGGNFSLAWDPAVEATEAKCRENAEKAFAEKSAQVASMVDSFCISGEAGGNLDYSAPAQEKFRQFLKEKYGTIEKLNNAWHAQYKDFAEIQAAKNAAENKANYLEFRDFCGKLFVRAIDRAVRRVKALDPLKRPATSQFSNFDFGAAQFFKFRPVDIEELILDGMKETDNYAWDGYCADDYMGYEVDLVASFARGKKIYQREFNTHSPDWRIAARTYWTMVGKGVKGVSLFQFQEGGGHDSYPKWALTNVDLSPREKLFAFSDAMQEIHRIENVLSPAKQTRTVKPVAIYFSRIDMQLQEKALASAWGEAVDTPYHVYEMLRSKGYPVTVITPRQIRDGFLDSVGAVVLVDAQHIAPDVVDRMIDWTEKRGGALIADSWPGAYSDLGFRQDKLMDFFGIRSAKRVKKDSIKLEESVQGYGEVTIDAINPDTLQNTVTEIWQQWDSKHPVAKEVGNFMISGYGAQNIECIDGEVVGMTFNGAPAIVCRNPGKGNTMYFAAMLGSFYGGSCTRYEWDSTHQANDTQRILDAFLKNAGVRKAYTADLPERVAAKLRVEFPLADGKGNAFIAVTSFNDMPLAPFPLRLAWNAPAPKMLFAAHGGSRALTRVPFTLENGELVLTMPGIDSAASLIALTDSVPLLSLDFPGAARGAANVVSMSPGDVRTVRVTVWNPSAKPLAAGKVSATLPEGWFCDKAEAALSAIPAFGSAETEFKIAGPAFRTALRARPVSFRFEANGVKSMPCTEVIRWK